MEVKMRFDGLIFVGLSAEQVESVEYHADNCTILKDEGGGVQVNGKPQDLYALLYALTMIYDLEVF